MEWYHYVLVLVGSALAGGINTLAGNGSVITLSLLTEVVGLPGNVANGTNRIGVLFSGIGGTAGFYKGGKLRVKESRSVMLWVTTGALAGGGIAMVISHAQFMSIFRILMLLMLVVTLVHPSRWMIEKKLSAIVPEWITYIMYFILGVYGGLIQMGMGIFFLAVLVLLSRYPMVEANAIKSLVVAVYTLLLIIIFHFRGMIDWPVGLLMGAGQLGGGWMIARFASRDSRVNKYGYYFLVAIIVISLASLFHIL